MLHACARVKENSVQGLPYLDAVRVQPYGAGRFSRTETKRCEFPIPSLPGGTMPLPDSRVCGICGLPAAPAPRLTICQERHYDCPRQHVVGLCDAHGSALQAGTLALHELLFDWTQKHHTDLYDGTRLVLWAEPMCLGCNAPLSPEENATSVHCAACGKTNVLGSALGSPAFVRLG